MGKGFNVSACGCGYRIDDRGREKLPFFKKLEILPNPVLDPNSSSIHREPIVLGVGRLCPEKGFDRLIDAL